MNKSRTIDVKHLKPKYFNLKQSVNIMKRNKQITKVGFPAFRILALYVRKSVNQSEQPSYSPQGGVSGNTEACFPHGGCQDIPNSWICRLVTQQSFKKPYQNYHKDIRRITKIITNAFYKSFTRGKMWTWTCKLYSVHCTSLNNKIAS